MPSVPPSLGLPLGYHCCSHPTSSSVRTSIPLLLVGRTPAKTTHTNRSLPPHSSTTSSHSCTTTVHLDQEEPTTTSTTPPSHLSTHSSAAQLSNVGSSLADWESQSPSTPPRCTSSPTPGWEPTTSTPPLHPKYSTIAPLITHNCRPPVPHSHCSTAV